MIIILFLTVEFKFKMEEALRRIAAWTDGILDLSELELDELPPLPATLTQLSCRSDSFLCLTTATLAFGRYQWALRCIRPTSLSFSVNISLSRS